MGNVVSGHWSNRAGQLMVVRPSAITLVFQRNCTGSHTVPIKFMNSDHQGKKTSPALDGLSFVVFKIIRPFSEQSNEANVGRSSFSLHFFRLVVLTEVFAFGRDALCLLTHTCCSERMR